MNWFGYLNFFFKALKVKLNEDSTSAHILYFKQHNVSKSPSNESDAPNKRTLFVSNVPPYFTEQSIKTLFGSFGKVEKVHFCVQPTSSPFLPTTANGKESHEEEESGGYFDSDRNQIGSFKLAYVLFVQPESIEKSMKKSVADKERELTTNSSRDNLVCTGMKSMIEVFIYCLSIFS